MPKETKSEKPVKERFELKLDPKLLADLEEEAKEKDTSVTRLIDEALRDRKTAHEIATDALDEHFIKVAGLCLECAAKYKASVLESGFDYMYRPRKLLREMLWRWWGIWEHGKHEAGCPGSDKDIDPAELAESMKRVFAERTEEILGADASFRRA